MSDEIRVFWPQANAFRYRSKRPFFTRRTDFFFFSLLRCGLKSQPQFVETVFEFLGRSRDLLAALLGAGVGAFAVFILERARTRNAEERAEKAEQELEQIQRRLNSPRLFPSDAKFSVFYRTVGQGNLQVYSSTHENVLCWMRPEVSRALPAGTDVVLLVENAGADWVWLTCTLDGESVRIEVEPPVENAENRKFLIYKIDPAKFGRSQTLTVKFESKGGLRSSQTYRTVHGQRVLELID